jgi:hypothetical protein
MFNSRSFIKSVELVFYANPTDLKTFMKAFAVCFIRRLSCCESSIIVIMLSSRPFGYRSIHCYHCASIIAAMLVVAPSRISFYRGVMFSAFHAA